MRIERDHYMGREEAIQRIDSFLEQFLAASKFPAGFQVVNPAKRWSGNKMDYSFTAKKGILRSNLEGQVEVTDDRVILDFKLPGILSKLISEEAIRRTFNEQFDRLFPDR